LSPYKIVVLKFDTLCDVTNTIRVPANVFLCIYEGDSSSALSGASRGMRGGYSELNKIETSRVSMETLVVLILKVTVTESSAGSGMQLEDGTLELFLL